LLFISAKVVVKIPENIYVVENEKLEVTCIARGSNPEITWAYSELGVLGKKCYFLNFSTFVTGNDSSNDLFHLTPGSDERISFREHNGLEDSVLIVEPVKLSDRGVFVCLGTNEYMKSSSIEPGDSDGMLRVKDKFAALWPFLGICAEVFVLCLIILIYEKRRNKTDLDER
jgi:hypothetical protein